jgi:transcriptional regulator with XRE-family HTH domain
LTGRELRNQRLRLGLTQQQLAMKLGVARNTITRWERGFLPDVPKYVPLALKGLESGFTGHIVKRRS